MSLPINGLALRCNDPLLYQYHLFDMVWRVVLVWIP